MIIMRLKQKGKLSASDLAAYLEVSKRTIYRDIDALSQMNIPITTHEGIHGGYEIDGSYFMPSVKLSEREVLILLLLLKISNQLNLPEFKESINSLNLKLQNTYHDTATQFKKNLHYISFDVQTIFPEACIHGAFETILEAFNQHVKLKILYFSPLKDSTIERVITPFHLFYNDGGWYLDAYCHLREKKRTFRLDRIKNISLLSEKIDESLEKQYNSNAFSDPKLLLEFDINKELFNLIQYDDPMRDVKIISENKSVIKMQVLTNRIVFFETLAIRNSDQITILKPESLVRNIQKKLLNALKKYQ